MKPTVMPALSLQEIFLQYKEGQWRHACAENLLSALPLAHVISSTPKGLEIQAWDETGFLSMPISIAAQKKSTAIYHTRTAPL